MAERIPRVPVREQDPKVRATNFEEVCYGYNEAEAKLEASRCLHCKNPRCVGACPVGIDIPGFIAEVASGNFAAAAEVIARDSSLPAVCGRVCPACWVSSSSPWPSASSSASSPTGRMPRKLISQRISQISLKK